MAKRRRKLVTSPGFVNKQLVSVSFWRVYTAHLRPIGSSRKLCHHEHLVCASGCTYGDARFAIIATTWEQEILVIEEDSCALVPVLPDYIRQVFPRLFRSDRRPPAAR